MKGLACSIVLLVATGCATLGADRPSPIMETKAQVAALATLSDITALGALRQGDPAGAISLLEAALDANITILLEVPRNQNVPGIDTFLRSALEYRAK